MSGNAQTVAPGGEPITLAEAKTWLRVDGTDEDVLITALIEAAPFRPKGGFKRRSNQPAKA